MGSILLTQVCEVVYRASYTREQAIELLLAAGDEDVRGANSPDGREVMSDRELGMRIAAIARNYRTPQEMDLNDRLVDDAQGWEIIDVGDWELTEVYGEVSG
jgi:hypothetical protein